MSLQEMEKFRVGACALHPRIDLSVGATRRHFKEENELSHGSPAALPVFSLLDCIPYFDKRVHLPLTPHSS